MSPMVGRTAASQSYVEGRQWAVSDAADLFEGPSDAASPQVRFEPEADEAEVSNLRCMHVQHGLCCICGESDVMMQSKDQTFTLVGLLVGFEGLHETHFDEQFGCH